MRVTCCAVAVLVHLFFIFFLCVVTLLVNITFEKSII